MKTGTAQTFIIISLIALLSIALPTTVLAADKGVEYNNPGDVNHIALAQYYKGQADEYQAKIADEIEAVKNKPRTSRFGRNAKSFSQHVEFKLHQYEVAVEENLNKAAYHEKMAAEQSLQPLAVSAGNSSHTVGS